MITINTPITYQDDLPDEVDVVVIGGGVNGIFSALNMRRKGFNVVVLEKGRIAGEQASRNWGWIRQQGRDAAELPIMMESTQLWEALDNELKGKTGFKRVGAMFCANSEKAQEKRESWLAISKAHGLQTEVLSQDKLSKHFKHDSSTQKKWVGAVYTPTDAKAEPWQAIPAVAALAHSEGVVVRENCAVRALDIQAGQIIGVITESGRIKSSQVVLAGGAWSSLFLRKHGINIPQLSVKASVCRTEKLPNIGSHCTADQGLAFRRRDDGGYSLALTDFEEHFVGPDSFRHTLKWAKLGMRNYADIKLNFLPPKDTQDAWNLSRHWQADEVSPFEKMRVLDPPPSKGKPELMQQRFAERFPSISKPKLLNAWAGMIDAMPDLVPIVDRVPNLEGLIIATGMSGHGFGIGPAFGKIIAEMACGEKIQHDMQRFRFKRFSDGSPLDIGPDI